MKYAKQPSAPEWFRSDDSKLYESAQSGSSSFNEWYEFDDRGDALDLIANVFSSQSFIDRFVWFDGDLYEIGQIDDDSMDDAEGSDDFKLIDGAVVAGLGEMVEAESRF
jgi:hypothetical protein